MGCQQDSEGGGALLGERGTRDREHWRERIQPELSTRGEGTGMIIVIQMFRS